MRDRIILLDYLHRCDDLEGAMLQVFIEIWTLNVGARKTLTRISKTKKGNNLHFYTE